MNAENTSVRAQPLFFIKESTAERNPTDALNVGRRSAEVLSLCNTRGSILEKNLTNVLNVEKPLARILGLLIIRESILGRNLTNAFSVGNPIVKAQIFLDISEDTMQKNFWMLWKFKKCKKSQHSGLFLQKWRQNQKHGMIHNIVLWFSYKNVRKSTGKCRKLSPIIIISSWKKWCHTCLETEILILIQELMPKSSMWCL